MKAYCERTGLGLGKVAQPIRVAVTGGTVSPPIFESLEFLGRQRTLARIDRCLAAVVTGDLPGDHAGRHELDGYNQLWVRILIPTNPHPLSRCTRGRGRG